MTAATAHSTIRDDMLAAIRDERVAAVAGIDPVLWGSESSPRVKAGDRGYIFGIHRGRLPLIELFETVEDHENTRWDGGWLSSTWTLRVHVGGVQVDDAEALARAITAAALAELRNVLRLKWGNERTAALIPNAIGHQLETSLTIENREDRGSFGLVTGDILLQTGGYALLQTGGGIQFEGGRLPTVIIPETLRLTDDGNQRVTDDGLERETE